MTDLTNIWDDWLDAEEQSENRMTAEQYNDNARDFYTKGQHYQAIELYQKAVEIYKSENNPEKEAEQLLWIGNCYYLEKKYKKALNYFLRISTIDRTSAAEQFKALHGIFKCALYIPIKLTELQKLRLNLEPYKSNHRIGDSKSMVLINEADIYYYRNNLAEFLNYVKEAFANRKNGYPSYAESVYYMGLIDGYLVNNQIKSADIWLQKWRRDGSGEFSDERAKQLYYEGKILYRKGKYTEAWDIFQKAYVERRYRGWRIPSTSLYWMVRIGSEMQQYDMVIQYLSKMFSFRNSENGFDCKRCYESFMIFYCCLYLSLMDKSSKHNSHNKRNILLFVKSSVSKSADINNKFSISIPVDQVKKRAYKWMERYEKICTELDNLLECDFRTKKVRQIKDFMDQSIRTNVYSINDWIEMMYQD